MKTKHLLQSLALLIPLGMFTGCVGYNSALFMTKSNAGLDFDMKPPTVEINISRKEGVVEPSFEGGKTPPVMASFSTKAGGAGGLHRFFFGVDQTFAGGDAAVTMAKLFVTNSVPADDETNRVRFDSGVLLSKVPDYNSPAKKGVFGWKKFLFGLPEPGEVRPFFFGTDSQLGVKVGWNGVGGPYPDNVKIGYNRKVIAVAPVNFAPREKLADGTIRTNVVRIPSFLATVDSDVEAETGVSVSWMQYFATGEAASYLARQPGIRQAMSIRADPASAEKGKEAELERTIIAGVMQSRTSAVLDQIDKLSDADALALEKSPPLADAELDKIVALRDPQDTRAKDPKAARKILKMRVVMGVKSNEQNLSAWESAVKPAR